jgi:short chain dehydrogenase
MSHQSKTVIVTGASQGIGAGVVSTFLKRGYAVVANSRNITKSGTLVPSDKLALVDGDIGQAATAAKVAEAAIAKFGSIDALVNNAGIFLPKPFTAYTPEDFKSLSSTNLEGYIYVTQLTIKQMLAQKTGGSIVGITTTLVEHPIAAVNASVAMITKGDPGGHAKSRDGIREGRYSGQRGCSGNRRHSDARARSQRVPDVFVAAWGLGQRPGHRRRRPLSHGGPSSDGRDPARRWRSACWQMVISAALNPQDT